jgi:ATP-dependent DNA ligase
MKPIGFIVPAQLFVAKAPPSGPGWIHEIKHDGFRVIARKDRDWCASTVAPATA